MKQVLENFERHVFKVCLTILLGIVGWFSSQVYLTLRDIQKQFGDMDKRVSMIEVSRSIYMERYIKIEGMSSDQQKILENLQSRVSVMENNLQRHKIY